LREGYRRPEFQLSRFCANVQVVYEYAYVTGMDCVGIIIIIIITTTIYLRISHSSGDDRETSFLFQRISILLFRFNSVLLHDGFVLDYRPEL